jgi:hypothetical protein
VSDTSERGTPQAQLDKPSDGASDATDVATDVAPRQTSRLVRFAVTLALLGCLAGMAWAFSLAQPPEQPEDAAIERLTPPPGSAAVPGQTPVIIDLAYDYAVTLTIDGVPVPTGQLVEEPATAVFTFTPGPGKLTERFTNGQHIAQIVYWPKSGSETEDAEVYQWAFNVV